ncbi:MAG: PQQ-binding-like beta-propeller repeat protein [Planctomycetota bacterium]
MAQRGDDFEGLLPGGRVSANDLAANGPVEVRNAWLFENEILIEGVPGNISALRRSNLGSIWYYDRLPGQLDFAPTASPLSFLFLSDGVLYEVERRLGNQIRGGIPLHFVASASPAATDSTAFVPCLAAGEGRPTIVTVNLATGIEGWRVATRSSVTSAAVSGGSSSRPMIYFAEENKGVYAYPAASAHLGAPDPSWARLTHGRNLHSPVVHGDLVLVGSDEGDFWALDRVTGVAHWSVMSGCGIVGSPAASGDHVYFSNHRGFHCYSREEGKHLWSYRQPGRFLVKRDEGIYVFFGRDTVHALDPETGELLRSMTFSEDIHFLTNMADDDFYAVTADGIVYKIDAGVKSAAEAE